MIILGKASEMDFAYRYLVTGRYFSLASAFKQNKMVLVGTAGRISQPFLEILEANKSALLI